MWALVTAASMAACVLYEIIAKKSVCSVGECSVLKLRISIIFFDTIALLFLWIFCYRGSGVNPLQIALENPLIIAASSLTVLDTLFYLAALKYIGLTVQEAYYGATGIIVFLGMLFVNLVSGGLGDIRKMLIPGKLIVTVIMIVASFILPQLSPARGESAEHKAASKRNMLLGLLFTFFGLTLDAFEGIATAYVFSESDISSVDYMSAGFLVAAFWGIIFYAILYFKTKKIFVPLKKENHKLIVYGLANLAFSGLYLYGSSMEPVQSCILWAAYPVFPIVAAAIFLKERYTVKQYICIGVIAVSSIIFSLSDYIF